MRLTSATTFGRSRWLLGTACVVLLAACGDDSGDEVSSGSSGNGGSGGGGNQAPVVAGTPPGSVVAGESYSFEPDVSDAEGDTVSFTIENLPSWASFDSTTGRVTGAPTSADIGTYFDIVLIVSDGVNETTVGPFDVTVDSNGARSVTVSWTPPTQNVDGSPLDLAGYRIYYGPEAGSYTKRLNIPGVGLTRYVVNGLEAGTYHFVMTSVSNVGVESEPTNDVSITLQDDS